MQRIHFIGIGGPVLSCMAIASSKKNSFVVSGSDVNISETACMNLKNHKLLPEKEGWFPEKINKYITAIIVGKFVNSDNPELVRAREMGLKILTYPEYMYLQTRSKTRIVVCGNSSKREIVIIIIYVLNRLKLHLDYLIEAECNESNQMVNFTYESRIAVIEGNENIISPLDQRPKFHLYKPHVAVITGLDLSDTTLSNKKNTLATDFKKFIDSIEIQGRLIYNENDENISSLINTKRKDIVSFTFTIPEHTVIDGITYLTTKKGNVAIKITEKSDLQNIEAARIACRQIGVYDDQFYSVIGDFTGQIN